MHRRRLQHRCLRVLEQQLHREGRNDLWIVAHPADWDLMERKHLEPYLVIGKEPKKDEIWETLRA